ncbi:MAG: histidine kinase, partial [Candidatus Competibacteraceae bacterium]|nr:histidine kinase [Candidatus Competibacteraceae bacterium]
RHNDVCDAGLGAALQDLLSRFEDRSGVDARLDTDTQAAGLADERAETVFRIVEEALNNVERHAGARAVRVVLRWADPQTAAPLCWDSDGPACVRVEIADDGVGFDPTAPCPGHYGLRGIREQAELIKARFELRSRPGEGTRIVLEFKA